MSAALLLRLREAGLTVTKKGDSLTVAPRSRVTDALRSAIQGAKRDLLQALAAEALEPTVPSLRTRIEAMAKRWDFSPDELAEALAGAESHPNSWLAWVEHDEESFGNCRTSEDFKTAHAQLWGLA